MQKERSEAIARRRKQGTLVSAYIEQGAYDALVRHCEITGQSKTKAIERAILSYCDGTVHDDDKPAQDGGTQE